MFTRAEFKSRAKEVLKRNYWTCFFVTLVMLIIGGNRANFNFSSKSSNGIYSSYANPMFDVLEGPSFSFVRDVVVARAPIILFIVMASILIGIFVVSALDVGKKKFFLDAKENHYAFKTLGFAFRHPRYMNIVKIMWFMNLYVFLWTLLFIIPGIIAGYRYRFVRQIVAENPAIEMSEAFALSIEMTNGIKMDLFILDLSFIGWYLLNLISFGLATFFIAPYVEATEVEVYKAFLNKTSTVY